MAKDDKAKKGKPPASADDIMATGALRPILKIAKGGGSVSCAVGLSEDGEGVILLHKQMSPKKLRTELLDQADKVGLVINKQTLRCGRASVAEGDETVLHMTVNKDVSGSAMTAALKRRLKSAGFSEIVFETSPSVESDDAAETDQTVPGLVASDPAAVADAPQGGDQPEPAPAAPPEPEAASAQPAQTVADLGALTSDLTGLVRRMIPLIAFDPSRQDTMKALAVTAQAAVKANDAAAAKTSIAALEKAIAGFEDSDKQSAATAAPVGPDNSRVLAKARSAWLATRKHVDADLGKLLVAIKTTYRDHSELAAIEKHVQQQLDTVLDALDDELAEKFDELSKAPPADRPGLVADAKKILERYQQHIATDSVIGDLDDNPFVPISVQKTVTAALSALSRSLS
jgi:hypothetical protein